ncbi:MAG: HD domain-containing protein [Vicinamibacterales bacterium]
MFAAALLYGPAAGTLIVALDGLVISFWISKRQDLHRALFNMSAPALSAWCGAKVFFALSGISPLVSAPAPLDQVLPALVLFALVYFGLNSWLITLAISFERRVEPLKVWRDNFIWLSLNYFCGASVAVLLVAETRQIDLRIIGVSVPLLLVVYFTFKTSMDRVEDANRHVNKVNSLYISTIETLALAIDAKDQVTHGHIRRVQRYTMGLARELGVVDTNLLQAIEAAALLHDMGKLAVPEHILNKPGRLTTAEYEQMKLHASVGAEILSAIDFPYPVVPIVRHHHEAWDGSGYPDGLAGTDIPIGARILSVVDCFDALTSDRPYRRRLSNAEALRILNDRKGSMYDPWVVSTFERVHQQLEAEVMASVPAVDGDIGTTVSKSTDGAASPLPERPVDLTPLIALECNALLIQMNRVVASEVAVFYRHDLSTNSLVADHVSSDFFRHLIGTQITIGERLSGWVAANRRAVINSDAALDLGASAHDGQAQLKYSLCVPVATSAHVVGVISLYSSRPFANRDESEIAKRIADIIRFAHDESESSQSSQPLRIAG